MNTLLIRNYYKSQVYVPNKLSGEICSAYERLKHRKMSFSKARRFSYPIPSSENKNRKRDSREFRKNEKIQTADLVEMYRKERVQMEIIEFRNNQNAFTANTSYEISEIEKTEDSIRIARDELMKTFEDEMCAFRKQTELISKAFVEDINKSSRVFSEKVQIEIGCIIEGVQENLKTKDMCGSAQKNDNFENIQLRECKLYIGFLENKYRQLLTETEKKISEQNHLISLLKAELDASALEEMLQGILLK